MREIKYRLWCNNKKEWKKDEWHLTPDGIIIDTRRNIEMKKETHFLNQFTGLFDKQGVEIYEGDIIIVKEEDEDSCMGREFSYKGAVSYGNSLKLSGYVPQYPSSFCLISKSFYREQALLFNDRWEYEVIGNIYENPELIENEKS